MNGSDTFALEREAGQESVVLFGDDKSGRRNSIMKSIYNMAMWKQREA